ncbi:MAG: hypothetical protein KDD44_00905 [Bdellovibrionales bacterium]|nr:hypothetical protein [Bdellovibrionales bacterium]
MSLSALVSLKTRSLLRHGFGVAIGFACIAPSAANANTVCVWKGVCATKIGALTSVEPGRCAVVALDTASQKDPLCRRSPLLAGTMGVAYHHAVDGGRDEKEVCVGGAAQRINIVRAANNGKVDFTLEQEYDAQECQGISDPGPDLDVAEGLSTAGEGASSNEPHTSGGGI